MTKSAVTLAVLALAGALVPAAHAATPDRTVQVGAAPTFEFEGPDATAANLSTQLGEPICGAKDPLFYCDHTLIEVDRPGLMVITFEPDSAGMDPDPYIWKSDADGNETGDPLFEAGGGAGAPETAQIEVTEPGFFMVTVGYFQAVQEGYVAKGTFEPLAAAAPPIPGAGMPTPAPANRTPSATIAKASRRTISGTAADPDGKVAKVEVGVVRRSGNRCSQLRANGTFARTAKCVPSTFLTAKGTSRWSLKLPKKGLRKGRYLLFARATDDKGAVQGGFTGKARRSLAVR